MKYIILLLCVFVSISSFAQDLTVNVQLEYQSENTFKLNFSENVDPAEAAEVTNYTISGTGGLTGNPVSADISGSAVTLLLASDMSELEPNAGIEVRVSNVTAVSGKELNPQQSVAKYFVWHFCETFSKAPLTGAYTDYTYVGEHNLNWTYSSAREDTEYEKGIMLRFKDSSTLKHNFGQGVASVSFQFYTVWSNYDDRYFECAIADQLLAENAIAISGNPSEVKLYTYDDLNIMPKEEGVPFEIKNTTVTNQNIVIDNVKWTSYSPAFVDTVLLSSQKQFVLGYNQLIDSRDVTIDNFKVEFDGVETELSTVEYFEGNMVKITTKEDISGLDNKSVITVTSNNVRNLINGLSVENKKSITVEKPEVVKQLEYIDFTTLRLRYTYAIDETDALMTDNYKLVFSDGVETNPSAVVMVDDKTFDLTVPSTQHSADGTTITVDVINVKGKNGVFTVAEPNNRAAIIIDRTAPEVLPELEFINSGTLILYFSEAVKPSLEVSDYVIGGTAGLNGNVLNVDINDSASVVLTVADMSESLVHDNTITVSANNVFDVAGNNLSENNTATYVINLSKPLNKIVDVKNIRHRTADVIIDVDRPGTVYWSAYVGGSSGPDADAVYYGDGFVNGMQVVDKSVSQATITVDELVWATSFDVYTLVESREGVLSELDMTTIETTSVEEGFDDGELGNYKSVKVTLKSGVIQLERMDKQASYEPIHVKVYNLAGAIVYSKQFRNETMDIHGLPSGIYLVSLWFEDHIETTKIIME
ncbi:Por secretion system C-terminal sorting domain-containing protein [Mariniphaga anaerophila]|uniref:Por secretion system C-terminal sorting domain-containing protein n=1 Tax=Mariniphaga anaerophila TaxID=1484053 RepID=A0A1M4SWF4_9BACT|nr:T9SS type A sorting domain-containing protein [Mariniphaga anaerophila]SHE36554.1 Por secretion system C-terminal sorting domain-containing protein [Mariniphaga anaerophila]